MPSTGTGVVTTGHGLVPVALEADQIALAIVITEIFVDKYSEMILDEIKPA